MSEAVNLPEPERLWQVHDVAVFLGLSKSWVYRESAAGRMPSLNIGGALRFDPGEIRAWVGRRRAPRAGVVAFSRGNM